jgi:putative phage-type endonuclease
MKQTREQWLANRRLGVGGSDIAAVLGLSPWRSAVDVWKCKVSDDPPVDNPTEQMRWGTILEGVVADEYARTTGQRVQRVNAQLRHPQHAWAIGNIDRAVTMPATRARVVGTELRGAQGILECKTASAYSLGEWEGPDGGPAVPVYYTAQVLWYIGIAGVDWADVAVLVGGQRYLQRRVERNDETLRAMFAAAEEFWRGHVLERIPPEPKSARDVVTLFPRDSGDYIDASQNGEMLSLVSNLRAAKADAKAKAEWAAQLEEAVKLRIGERSGIALDGKPVVTWKAAKDSLIVDWEGVAKDLEAPEWIVKQRTTTRPGSRRFIVKD